jgi:hypothetical protein
MSFRRTRPPSRLCCRPVHSSAYPRIPRSLLELFIHTPRRQELMTDDRGPRPHCHRASSLRPHGTSLTLPCPAREHMHKGGSGAWTYARTRRRSGIPTTSRSLPRFSGGGSWAEPFWKTAHQRIPVVGVSIGGFAFRIPASSACARFLFLPGTCDPIPRRTDASDSAAPCAWSSPNIPAP